jgi:hypothetical protein
MVALSLAGRMFVVDPEDEDAVAEAAGKGKSADEEGSFDRSHAADRKRSRRPWGQEEADDWASLIADRSWQLL